MSMHNSKGDLPRCTVYRGIMKFTVIRRGFLCKCNFCCSLWLACCVFRAQIGEVKVQLFPAQLMLLATCFENFGEQVRS